MVERFGTMVSVILAFLAYMLLRFCEGMEIDR